MIIVALFTIAKIVFQKVETTQMYFDEQVVRQIVVLSYHETILSNKKEL